MFKIIPSQWCCLSKLFQLRLLEEGGMASASMAYFPLLMTNIPTFLITPDITIFANKQKNTVL